MRTQIKHDSIILFTWRVMRLMKIQLSGLNAFGVLPLLQQGRLRQMAAKQPTSPMAPFLPHVSLDGMQG